MNEKKNHIISLINGMNEEAISFIYGFINDFASRFNSQKNAEEP